MPDARGFTYGLAIGAGFHVLARPSTRRCATCAPSRPFATRRARRRALREGRDARPREPDARCRRTCQQLPEGPSEDELSEDVIVARVRTRLGRVTSHAHAIEVRFKEGSEIELKGPALASEHDRIVRAASRVSGVERIDDDLVVYDDVDGVPGLQNGGADAWRATGRKKPTPAAALLASASIAAALVVMPFARPLLRAVVYGITRNLLTEARPIAVRFESAKDPAAQPSFALTSSAINFGLPCPFVLLHDEADDGRRRR